MCVAGITRSAPIQSTNHNHRLREFAVRKIHNVSNTFFSLAGNSSADVDDTDLLVKVSVLSPLVVVIDFDP